MKSIGAFGRLVGQNQYFEDVGMRGNISACLSINKGFNECHTFSLTVFRREVD